MRFVQFFCEVVFSIFSAAKWNQLIFFRWLTNKKISDLLWHFETGKVTSMSLSENTMNSDIISLVFPQPEMSTQVVSTENFPPTSTFVRVMYILNNGSKTNFIKQYTPATTESSIHSVNDEVSIRFLAEMHSSFAYDEQRSQ